MRRNSRLTKDNNNLLLFLHTTQAYFGNIPGISHLSPSKVGGHIQDGFIGSSLSLHVPPFKQGLGSQGETKTINVMPQLRGRTFVSNRGRKLGSHIAID